MAPRYFSGHGISASAHSFSAFANCSCERPGVGIVKLPALATWLYFRFALSYSDVAEMMGEPGVTVSYETIRGWSQKFGGTYAKRNAFDTSSSRRQMTSR